MDIHPHAGPIRSIREYLVHLSMVVLGILIALGLEQWREASHSHAIAQRALDDMLTEMRDNRAQVATALAELVQLLPYVQGLLDLQRQAIEARRTHAKPPAEPQLSSHGVDWPTFSTAAWDNALAMQALGRIDFETERKLARVYSRQRDVKEGQSTFSTVATHFDTMSGRQLNDTPERMIERLGALQEVATWMGRLEGSYRQLLKEYDEAVAPRAPAPGA